MFHRDLAPQVAKAETFGFTFVRTPESQLGARFDVAPTVPEGAAR